MISESDHQGGSTLGVFDVSGHPDEASNGGCYAKSATRGKNSCREPPLGAACGELDLGSPKSPISDQEGSFCLETETIRSSLRHRNAVRSGLSANFFMDPETAEFQIWPRSEVEKRLHAPRRETQRRCRSPVEGHHSGPPVYRPKMSPIAWTISPSVQRTSDADTKASMTFSPARAEVRSDSSASWAADSSRSRR